MGFSDLADGLGLAAVLRDVDDVPALAGLDVDVGAAGALWMALSWFPRVLFSSWVSMQS